MSPVDGDATVRPGDRVLLLDLESDRSWIVTPDGGGARKERGLGVFDPDRLVGMAYGRREAVGARQVMVLRPSLADVASTLRRKAQIITAKDASRIVWELGIGPGDRVLESGVGSGGVTLPLLWAVGPDGQVVGQELRQEFADWTMDNAQSVGLEDRLHIHIGDLTVALAPEVKGPFEACLLDQPEPWSALPHILPVLAPGARLAAYTPQVSQMEKMVHALREAGFARIRCMELIERAWEVKDLGSRPSFDGLGHTGFLVFARWLGPDAGAAAGSKA